MSVFHRPLWRIRHQIFWAKLFARLAGPDRGAGDRSELNDELASLHFELAKACREAGLTRESLLAERDAFEYARRGTSPERGPAGALAMPAPGAAVDLEVHGQEGAPSKHGNISPSGAA